MSSKFEEWKEALSHEFYVQHGLHLSEVPEFHWWQYYNNGSSIDKALDGFFKCKEAPDDLSEDTLSNLQS